MKNASRTILALKYRPQNFDELIGQEVIAQTIKNSIKFNKIPNAYLLTGIRGVGKTTTARIIAKALNCTNNFESKEKCKPGEFCNCEEITKSNHIDVIEMDAASKTGIDDVRELIESSKYYPSNSKFKVYIIDEVHMLSKQAFNGLLKTLEEPPSHLKFIFATTELKKIPVTIISRCQRFDLSRVSLELLFKNLKKITEIEKGKISDQALKLIAKVSEGSVRDSLSLLDRALISQSFVNKEIDEDFVQTMLGIADHSKILELLKNIISGDQKKVLGTLRTMIEKGVEAKAILNDLLEIIYHVINFKNFGKIDLKTSISDSKIDLINEISENISKTNLFLFWQFILKGLDEINIVSNQSISLEMIMLRLIHIKDLPDYHKIISNVSENIDLKKSEKINNLEPKENPQESYTDANKNTTEQLKNITQNVLEISEPDSKNEPIIENLEKVENFEKLIYIAGKKREIELKFELEKNVNLVSFSQGKINISFNENLGKNFIRNLTERLLEWTGKRWIISLSKEKGQKTFFEKDAEEKFSSLKKEKNSNLYKKFIENFPDADLVDIITEE